MSPGSRTGCSSPVGGHWAPAGCGRKKSEKKGRSLPKEASAPSHLNWFQSHLLPLGEAFPLNNDCDDLAGRLSLDAGRLSKGFFSPNNCTLSCTEKYFLLSWLLSQGSRRKEKVIIFQPNISPCNCSFGLIIFFCFLKNLFPGRLSGSVG